MLKEIIAQKDDQCGECGDDIAKGSRCYVNSYDYLVCYSCVANEVGYENF